MLIMQQGRMNLFEIKMILTRRGYETESRR